MDSILSQVSLIASQTATEASKMTSKLTTQLVEKTLEYQRGKSLYETNLTDIERHLQSNHESEKIDALTSILALMSRGEDARSYFPLVVKNVSCDSLVVRKLIYIYLLKYAEEEPDLSLLSINSFQKDLNDANPMIRTIALRVLSSINVPIIVPIVMASLKKCAVDLSPYVRKAVAISLPKCYHLEPTTREDLVEILQLLLKDNSSIVLGAAITALCQIVPSQLDLLHKHFHKLCSLLIDSDEWNQLEIISVLKRYARAHFPDPSGKLLASLDEDHQMLIKSFMSLLNSPNPAVIVQISSELFDVADKEVHEIACQALIRCLFISNESVEILLKCIKDFVIVNVNPWFRYLEKFAIYPNDSRAIINEKLKIMDALCSVDNSDWIIAQFESYIYSSNSFLAMQCVRVWKRLASRIPQMTKRSMKILVSLLSNSDGVYPRDELVGEAVVAIRELLQNAANSDSAIVDEELVTYLISIYSTVTVPSAKASILWLIGHQHSHLKSALDAVRISLKNFCAEDCFLKKQILTTIAILYLQTTLDKQDEKLSFLKLALEYGLNLARLDLNYDVRDQARLIERFVDPTLDEGAKRRFLDMLTQVLPMKSDNDERGIETLTVAPLNEIGTLAHLFDRTSAPNLLVWADTVIAKDERKREEKETWNKDRVVLAAPKEIVKTPTFEKRIVNLDEFYGSDNESSSEYETESN